MLSQLASRPLLTSTLDAALFVNRDRELDRLEKAIAGSLNALVIGRRGSGKTSLLHQLERRFDDNPEVELLFVEGLQGAKRPSQVISLLAFARGRWVDRDTELIERQIADQEGTRIEREPRSETEEALQALRVLESRLSSWKRRTIFVLDELPSPTLAYLLFGRLRDELWRLSANWIVAAAPHDSAAFLQPPANDFFEVKLELDPLEDKDAVDLLRRRVDDPTVTEKEIREIVANSSGDPKDLITLARQELLFGEKSESIATKREQRRKRASEIGEVALQLIDYLESNGPASASDTKLQAAFGWSRSRATQLFRELERAGLAQAMTERSGSGRRKLYGLKE